MLKKGVLMNEWNLKRKLYETAPGFYLLFKRVTKGPVAVVRFKYRIELEAIAREIAPEVDLQKLGRSVFGPAHYCIATSSMSGGHSNEGIFVHEFSTTEGKTAGRIVEKVTRDVQEAALAVTIMKSAPVPNDIIPDFHAVSGMGGRYHVFMEHIDWIDNPAQRSEDYAPELARSMTLFQRRLEEIGRQGGFSFPTVRIFRTGEQRRLLKFVGPNTARDISRKISALQSFTGSQQKELCHEDVNWFNMGLANGGANQRNVFIDIAGPRYNIPGAALYRFAIAVEQDREYSAFFRRLSREYADLVNLPVEVIRLGACFYASCRHFLDNENENAPQSISLLNQAYDHIF